MRHTPILETKVASTGSKTQSSGLSPLASLMLQSARERQQPAAGPRMSPAIYLSSQPAVPTVIASQPSRTAASPPGEGGRLPPPLPELLLSPSLLGLPPELRTVLPLEEQINQSAVSDDAITNPNFWDRESLSPPTISAVNSKADFAPSLSLTQLISSLQECSSDSGDINCGGDIYGGVSIDGCGGDTGTEGGNVDDEYTLLDLNTEPEVEYVVIECSCHTTVHYWRTRGQSRSIRCYGSCGRVLAAPGPTRGTLRLQRAGLFYHFQHRRAKKKNKMYGGSVCRGCSSTVK